ncbi:hypothetical protein ACWERV_32015 [Streptomyces sp. NPDC004031]
MNGGIVPDHVRVELDGTTSEAWRCSADVLFGTGAPDLAAKLIRRYPGCLVVSLRDGSGRCVTLVRAAGGGVVVRVHSGVGSACAHAVLVSLLYGQLVAGD